MPVYDVLQLKAALRDAVAKLKSFLGFPLELQKNPMPFRLYSLWGATLTPFLRTGSEAKYWGRVKTQVLF